MSKDGRMEVGTSSKPRNFLHVAGKLSWSKWGKVPYRIYILKPLRLPLSITYIASAIIH